MSSFRFLTSFVLFFLFSFHGNLWSQEIADFEIRKMSPTLPFQLANNDDLTDDQGDHLPSNQCSDYLQVCHPYLTQCGFSSSQNPRNTISDPPTAIDLSPLSFECFQTASEMAAAKVKEKPSIQPVPPSATASKETAEGSKGVTAEASVKLKVAEAAGQQLSREQARAMMKKVFRKSSNIEEVLDDQLDIQPEYQFVPYQNPSPEEGSEPVVTVQWKLRLSELKALLTNWKTIVVNHELITAPNHWLSERLVELECHFCGSPVWGLIDGFQREVALAEKQILQTRELKRIRNQVKILNGMASVLRLAGDSLIQSADIIVISGQKRVESASRTPLSGAR